jgi:hypothetical protein
VIRLQGVLVVHRGVGVCLVLVAENCLDGFGFSEDG